MIVVDDGSTDGSATVLAHYASRGVRVIHQENAGQCAAANRAFAAAAGAFVKFFDADDIMAPGMIERQVGALPDAAMPSHSANGTASRGTIRPQRHVSRRWPCTATPACRLAGAGMGRTPAPMMQCALWLIPRDILERRGLWDERLSLINDFEFIARVVCSVPPTSSSRPARVSITGRVSSGSLSGTRSRKAVESAFLSLMLGTSAPARRRGQPAYAPSLRQRPSKLRLRLLLRPCRPPGAGARRIATLGGSDLAPDGPPGFQRLRRLVGWRAARRVQHLAERLRLNRAARRPLVWRRQRASGAVS